MITELFQDDDKEEMKEILEMKRRHERHVKKRFEKLQGVTNVMTSVPS